MNARPLKSLSFAVSLVLFLNVTGCGYILHPERRGQTGGNIDPAIAIMDGIGLLLFVIPGVIAFAVDFSSGAIYYPGGRRSATSLEEMNQCAFEPKGATPAMIERIILERTGIDVRLDRDHVRVIKMDSLEAASQYLALNTPSLQVAGAGGR